MDSEKYPAGAIDPKPASRRLTEDDLADNGAVEFQCLAEERSSIPDPLPAGDDLPGWFRNLDPVLDDIFHGSATTAKMCMPFTEALSGGWLLRAPERIAAERDGEQVTIENDGETEFVTHLETGESGCDGNSRFHKPDLLIDTRWAINVPDGYGLLIMPPLNRDEWGIESMGMCYVPSGETEELPFVEIPAVVWEDTELSEGDPLATVYPIPLDSVPSTTLLGSLDEGTPLELLNSRVRSRKRVNPHYFREEMWVPRPSATLTDTAVATDGGGPAPDRERSAGDESRESASDAETARCPETGEEGDVSNCPYMRTKQRFAESAVGKVLGSVFGESSGTGSSTEQSGDENGAQQATDGGVVSIGPEMETKSVPANEVTTRGETPADLFEVDIMAPVPEEAYLYCAEDYYGVVPEPVPASRYIREWHRELDTVIPAIGDSPFPIQESVLRAMSLGPVIRYPADVHIKWNGEEYEVRSNYEMSIGRFQGQRRLNLDGTDTHVYTTDSPWRYWTAPGTTTLMTSPFNHFQEPYRCASGLMDSDKYFDSANGPGLLRTTDKELHFPRGMPTCQLITFDREQTIYRGEVSHRTTNTGA